jgi:hypothetical protein
MPLLTLPQPAVATTGRAGAGAADAAAQFRGGEWLAVALDAVEFAARRLDSNRS